MKKKIDTLKLGKIEYNQKDEIYFPMGLFGFEVEKNFLLVKNNGNDFFYYLQSTHDPELTFILANPKMFFNDYVLDVDEHFIKNLEITSIVDFGIVTVLSQDQEEAMSINLMGPILIDIKKQIGIQAISLNDHYHTKHKISYFFNQEKPMTQKVI